MGANRSNLAYIDIESDEELIIRRKRSASHQNINPTYIFPAINYVTIPHPYYSIPQHDYRNNSYSINFNSNTKNHDKSEYFISYHNTWFF